MVSAHNPLSARYHFEAGSLASELTINLSQDGVNQALLQSHDRPELEALPRKAFEELIVAYVKDNFDLSVNGQVVSLKQGGIKLGDHQTDLRFVLPAFTEPIERIKVNIPAFRENDHHQTIFSYVVEGMDGHVILSNENDYRTAVNFSAQEAETGKWELIGSVGLILVLGVSWYRNRRNF